MKIRIADTETFVPGRSREQAATLLAKAAKAGIDPTLIRTTIGGYLVPTAILGLTVETAKPFNPTTHTVAEVEQHLASADAEEIARVIAAERAGRGRKGIVENTKE